MNTTELEAILRRLAATWPTEWDHDRVIVWTEELLPLDHDTVLSAVKSMAKAERWLSIAAFHEHMHPSRGNSPGVVNGEYWTPGIGFGQVVATNELTERSDHDASVIHIAAAREALRKKDRPA